MLFLTNLFFWKIFVTSTGFVYNGCHLFCYLFCGRFVMDGLIGRDGFWLHAMKRHSGSFDFWRGKRPRVHNEQSGVSIFGLWRWVKRGPNAMGNSFHQDQPLQPTQGQNAFGQFPHIHGPFIWALNDQSCRCAIKQHSLKDHSFTIFSGSFTLYHICQF